MFLSISVSFVVFRHSSQCPKNSDGDGETLLVLVFKALVDAANSIQLVIVATQLYQN